MENPKTSGVDSSHYINRLKKASNKNELGRLLNIFYKSLPVIVGIMLASIIVALSIIRWTSPIYQSNSILQLGQNDKASEILEVNQMFEDDDLFAELEFIQSNLLITKTIEDLNLKVRYFSEGNFLTHELYPHRLFQIDSLTVHDPSLYGKKIYVNIVGPESFDLSIENQQNFSKLKINEVHNFPSFSFRLQTHQPLDVESMEQKQYFTINSSETLAHEFKKTLVIKPDNSRAKSILLSIKLRNPTLAKDFINAHVRSYMHYKEEKQKQSAENILAFLTNQLDTVSKNLQDAERLLASFKSSNNFTGQSSNSLFDHLDEYDNETIELEFQDNILQELEALTKKNDDDIDIYHLMAQLVGSNYEEALKGMLNELSVLLKERERYKYNITEENERIKMLNYQIGIQKKLIQESITSLRSKLIGKKKLLNEKKKMVEKQFINIPTKEVELARYQRLFNISEKYYNLLLEKRTEYKISKAGYVTNNKILSKAQLNNTPVYPNKPLVFGGILFLGLILSVIYTLLKYLTNKKISTVSDIIKHTDASIKILGVIPATKVKDDAPTLLIRPNNKTLFAESMRSIKTNLQFNLTAGKSVSIAITSTVSGEGKTFIAVNLASVLSLSGKRVIVIDLDLRKPKVHRAFDTNNALGLSDYLANKCTLEDVIHHSDITNLHYITSGMIPSNPFELSNNGSIEKLINILQETYDYVVLDTAPIGLVSDGFATLQHVDCPIYIFRSDYSEINYIQNVDRLVHENNIHNISCILNGVKLSKTNYGPQLGYGYGYGSSSKQTSGYYTEQ